MCNNSKTIGYYERNISEVCEIAAEREFSDYEQYGSRAGPSFTVDTLHLVLHLRHEVGGIAQGQFGHPDEFIGGSELHDFVDVVKIKVFKCRDVVQKIPASLGNMQLIQEVGNLGIWIGSVHVGRITGW